MIFLPESLQEWAAQKQFTVFHVETLRLFLARQVDPNSAGDPVAVQQVAENSYRKADELLTRLRERGHETRMDEYVAWVSARAAINARPSIVQKILAEATGTEPDLMQNPTVLAGITGRMVISSKESDVAPVMQAAIDTLIAEGVSVSTLRLHDIVKKEMQATLSSDVRIDPVPA